jgi:hypothetical protein
LNGGNLGGVVILSQIEQSWPIIAIAEAWNFNDLACGSTDPIWQFSLNVTTPTRSLQSADNRLTVGPWCLAGPGLERANKVLL